MRSDPARDVTAPREVGVRRTKKEAQMDFFFLAVPTRLELATSGVTGRYSNQLNYSTVFVVGVYGFEPQTLCL